MVMKYYILFAMITFTLTATAQLRQVYNKDSVRQKVRFKTTSTHSKTASIISVKAAIENELGKMLDVHKNEPNNSATWKKIKADAENILHNYFKNGKLFGNKPAEAYYVKIGNETMTAADISNQTFVLQAGIATVKPAEFENIRIEKTGIK